MNHLRSHCVREQHAGGCSVTSLVLQVAATLLLLLSSDATVCQAASQPISLVDAAKGAQTLSSLLYGNLPPGIKAPEGPGANGGSSSASPPPTNTTDKGSQGNSHARRMLQSGCSTTDASAAAVLACTNAVRTIPAILADAPCYASVKSSLLNPPRKALTSNSKLTSAAVTHNNWMIKTNTMSHQLSGEAALGARISSAGYSWSGLAENIAMGYTSAKAVVSGWLCSDGHRANMFSCSYSEIGVAAGSKFYTQDFGCPSGTTCNSCGSSGGNGSSGGGGSSGGSTDTYTWLELRPMHFPKRDTCTDIRGAVTGNGIAVQQWTCNKTPAQKFRLVSSGSYWNVVDAWGRCLDVSGASTANGAGLVMWQCNGGYDQQFSFEAASQQYVYRLRPRHSSKCVGIRGSSTTAGVQFTQQACVSGLASQGVMLYSF